MKEKRKGRRRRRKERKRKKNKKQRRWNKKCVAPSNAFPSTKLGNNITPINGRLGKNTIPTSRDPIKLNRNLQMNPPQRRSSFEIPSRTNLIYTP